MGKRMLAQIDRFLPSWWVFRTWKGVLLVVIPLLIISFLTSHELAVRYFPDIACVACHEMKEPVKNWKDSGVAKNHPNCADCHFDAGLARVWEMNRESVRLFVQHFRRDPNEPIKPPPEPLFLELGREPGYYSLVPNNRCYQCKDAKNHRQIDQPKIHSKLKKDIVLQPCKDCHNHEMRKGQKFYEKILPEGESDGKVATN